MLPIQRLGTNTSVPTVPVAVEPPPDNGNLWHQALRSLEAGDVRFDTVFCAAHLLTSPDRWPTRGMVISGLSASEPMHIAGDPQSPFEPLLLHWDGRAFIALDPLGAELLPEHGLDGLRSFVQAVWQGLAANGCIDTPRQLVPEDYRQQAVTWLIAQMTELGHALRDQYQPEAHDTSQPSGPPPPLQAASQRTPMQSPAAAPVPAQQGASKPRQLRRIIAQDILIIQRECVGPNGLDRRKARDIATTRNVDISALRYYMDSSGEIKEAGKRKIAAALWMSRDPMRKEADQAWR